MTTIVMLGGDQDRLVGCSVTFRIDGVLPGDRILINGSPSFTLTTDPQYITYTSAITGTDYVDVEATIPPPPHVVASAPPFNWVYGIPCPDLGPTPAPILSVDSYGYDGVHLSWTPSDEYDPTFPTPILSYVLRRSRVPMSPYAFAERTWTLDPADPLEVFDASEETEGPRPGITYYYRVTATSSYGDTLSNIVSAVVPNSEVTLDGVRYRIGDLAGAEGGDGLSPITVTSASIPSATGVDLSQVRWRVD